MYQCNICNYNTELYYNFTRHNKTKKHLENINQNKKKLISYSNNKFICSNCQCEYSHKSSL